MCGLPGLTPDKMIDVDFEAIEDDPDGVVRIDNADFLSRPVRLGSSEASALIVALRALREGSPESVPRGHRPVPGQARGSHCQRAPRPARSRCTCDSRRAPSHTALLEEAIRTNRQARIDYYVPTRDETTTPHGRPAGAAHQRRPRLPRRVVPPRAGAPAVPARPDARGGDRRRTTRRSTTLAPRDLSEGLFEPGPDDVEAVLHLERYARWVADYYPVDSVEELGGGAPGGARCASATRGGWSGSRCVWRRGLTVVEPAASAGRRGRPHGARDALCTTRPAD